MNKTYIQNFLLIFISQVEINISSPNNLVFTVFNTVDCYLTILRKRNQCAICNQQELAKETDLRYSNLTEIRKNVSTLQLQYVQCTHTLK